MSWTMIAGDQRALFQRRMADVREAGTRMEGIEEEIEAGTGTGTGTGIGIETGTGKGIETGTGIGEGIITATIITTIIGTIMKEAVAESERVERTEEVVAMGESAPQIGVLALRNRECLMSGCFLSFRFLGVVFHVLREGIHLVLC